MVAAIGGEPRNARPADPFALSLAGFWLHARPWLRLLAYAPLCVAILLLGALGALPRVGLSTQGEGTERRYFYGTVWAVTIAQTVLLVLWKALPATHAASLVKLTVYVAVLALVGLAAYRGILPRTRPILPGELMVAD